MDRMTLTGIEPGGVPLDEVAAGELGKQAVTAIEAGDLGEAECALLRVLDSGHWQAKTMTNLGAIEFKREKFAIAAEWYIRCVAVDPSNSIAYAGLAACMLNLGRSEEALKYADAALAINPQEPHADTHRGVALTNLMRHEEALPSLLKGLERTPDHVPAIINLARTYRECNRYAEAIAWHSRALALDPSNVEANFSRGLAYLQLGDFRNGFAGYEWRWKMDVLKNELKKHPKPRWVGQLKLNGGTILLDEEQGIGDTIQFARYALVLADRGVKVVLRVRPTLRSLFACFEDRMMVIGYDDPLPPFDCHSPLLSLPLALGTTPNTIPASARYLSAPPARRESWSTRLGERGKPRIGIVWSGRPDHSNDRARSMALSSFPIPNPALFDVCSLQHVVRVEDQALLDSLDIAQLGPDFRDMADTSAVLELMDLVITVDTSVAHLAAAIGRPTWLLLSFNADWRWIHGHDSTAWYPTVRIFKQAQFGDWKGVFDRVTLALTEAAGLNPVSTA